MIKAVFIDPSSKPQESVAYREGLHAANLCICGPCVPTVHACWVECTLSDRYFPVFYHQTHIASPLLSVASPTPKVQ